MRFLFGDSNDKDSDLDRKIEKRTILLECEHNCFESGKKKFKKKKLVQLKWH